MNTTMADGAGERLDAQIADALVGQPGMSKMELANRLRLLRGDGGALLGSAAYPAAWMWPHPEDGSVRFTADGDVASEAAGMGRAVSALYRVPVQEDAHPSPAGQGDAAVKDCLTVGGGQPADAEIDARLNALYREMVDSGQHNGGMSGVAWDRAVYRMAANQPAHAVDLGPVREALQAAARSLRTIADSTNGTEFLETAGEIRAYAGSRASCAEQALIDCKAVG